LVAGGALALDKLLLDELLQSVAPGQHSQDDILANVESV
jgi:hypothetical protein